MNLYIARGDQTFGPYTEAQLQEYMRQGVFNATDLAAREGGDWLPLASVLKALASVPVPKAKVLPLVPLEESDSKRGIYIILGLFFGLLGIHNFYAGRLRVGTWQVIFFVLTAWTIVGALLELIFVVYELFTVTTDGKGKLLR